MMSKEELIKETQRLTARVNELSIDRERLKKELNDTEYELEEEKAAKRDLENKVYFLAGMLYKEWVSLKEYGCELNIEIVDKSEE